MENAKKGRPRAFDPDVALGAALRLFRQKGYEGTTLTDLTDAMGINRPSLYAALGKKEEHLRKAFERYAEGAGALDCAARACPCPREAVATLLYGAADALAENDHGCLTVVGALAGGEESDPVRQTLCAVRNASLDAWRDRLAAAQHEGALPPGADPAALSRYIMTVLNGMTVQARSGATREDLRSIAEIALRAWPA